MSKFIKLFFSIDLVAGLSLITTFISKMFFGNDKGWFITVAIAFGVMNLIVTLIAAKKFNFYKNVGEYAKK